MSFGKDNFIGLHFFDAIRIEAKSDSEKTTGEPIYTPNCIRSVCLSEVPCLRSILNYQIFQSTLVYLTVSDDIYKDVCRKIVPVVNLAVSIGDCKSCQLYD